MKQAETARLFKRYASARLYEVRAARYVGRVDLARMVQAGDSILVLDAETGQDITQSVLAELGRTRH